MAINLHELKARLSDHNFRLTKSRLIIYKVFYEHKDKHLNLDEVHRYCISSKSGVGIATIYRTAKLFENMGLIKKVDLGESCSRYEVVSSKRHIHLRCKQCNKVFELSQSTSQPFTNEILSKIGFTVTEFSLVNGICNKCRTIKNL